MASDDFHNVFRQALLANYLLPASLFILCVFGAAVAALGLRRGRFGLASFGTSLAGAGVYGGLTYTVMPFWLFGMMLGCGFLAGLKPEGARARRQSFLYRCRACAREI